MGKAALLIAVGEYRADFESLAAAENDLRALQRVLQLPEAGGFAADAVKTLINPGPQRMREELEGLFANRRKDDLLVLYFSGHGVTDDRGNFYLASTATQRDRLRATAVSARLILELMEDSRSKQQVVILDCCFSGAFANEMTAKGEPVNLGSQLGGQGRAVLTSSSATEYSFEQKESQLSVYTRYLVEGLETGAADLNGDGWIGIDELYEFTRRKVQEAAPAMQPKIHAAEAGYKIQLSKAPLGDPKLAYRKAVGKCAHKGEISFVGRHTLDTLRDRLRLDKAESVNIENQVLQPYREYQKKLKRFEQVVAGAVEQENPLSQRTFEELKNFQQVLGLRDQDVAAIEAQVSVQPIKVMGNEETPSLLVESQSNSGKLDKVESITSSNINLRGTAKRYISARHHLSTSSDQTQKRSFKLPLLLSFSTLSLFSVGLFFVNSNRSESVEAVNFTASLKPTELDLYSSTIPPAATTSPDEKSASEYYDEGSRNFESNDYEGAIDLLSKALELNPDYFEAYYLRGFSKYRLRDNQGAISDYTKAIELNPNYADAYTNRGVAKHALGDNQGAIADYDRALELNPEYVEAYFNRAVAKDSLGDYTGAIGDYGEAIRINPSYAKAYKSRGVVERNSGSILGAIADFDRAIEINPNYADAYYERAIAKQKSGDEAGAIQDYQQAANLYQQQGRTEEYQNVSIQFRSLQETMVE